MSIIGSNILAGASGQATGYNLNNSLRYRGSNSANLQRTPASATNRTTWTWSAWIKRGTIGTQQGLFIGNYDGNDNSTCLLFDGGDQLIFFNRLLTVANGNIYTTQVFRDVSAWYHIVVAMDTTQATAANRYKLYVNGNQVTSFAIATYPTQNTTMYINSNVQHNIGFRRDGATNYYFDGYMADVNFVDGSQLTPSSFGETSLTTGSWIPKKYTSTYGTNGFYLKFADTSAATAAAIGKDSSGNGNNWTPSGISVTAGSTYDAMTDVPTLTSATAANYATLNPVYKAASQPTLSNANLTVAGNTTNYQNAFSTIAVTSGKWYAEILITGTANSANMLGVSNQTQLNYFCSNADILGTGAGGTGYGYYFNGKKYSAGIDTTYGAALASGDILGIALDLDNGKIWFSLNGTWQASGDPAAGTNAAFTGIASDTWSIGSTSYSTGATSFNHNFGQRPFSYTAPSGFVALNTYNLPTPTILQGNKYMDATLYTGTGATASITNAASFKPDFVWIKCRSGIQDNTLFDSVRGTTKYIISNTTAAEVTDATTLTAFNSNGWTMGLFNQINNNASTYVGWQWQAGQGTTSSNTSGSITSTVSVNATAGFSVVTYTGTGANATVGHGLGVAPKMIIVKVRSTTNDWAVYHSGLTSAAYRLQFNSTIAQASTPTAWNSTAPTSTVFSLGTLTETNASAATYVAYCWAEIAGFSKFGSYTGNGSADGTFVYTGFRPKFLLIKRTDAIADWWLFDSSRDTYNATTIALNPNSTAAEVSYTGWGDLLSNGFKLRRTDATWNTSGGTYIYMAFAESPFKNANAR